MSDKDMAKQAHYEALSPQPIDVIRAWKLDFNLGNVIKYIGRCRTKGQELEDLKKAAVYLQWRIEELLPGNNNPVRMYRLRPYSEIKELLPGCWGEEMVRTLPRQVTSLETFNTSQNRSFPEVNFLAYYKLDDE